MEIYESGEMYLETILKLKNAKGSVRAVDIVGEMGHAKSSVSEALKVLTANGYIKVVDGLIELTRKGLELASEVYERHVILTEFFIKLGVNDKTAEADACRIEHIISDETFEKIKESIK